MPLNFTLGKDIPHTRKIRKTRTRRKVDWDELGQIVEILPSNSTTPSRNNWPRHSVNDIGYEALPGVRTPIFSEDINEPLCTRMAWAFMRPAVIIAQPEKVYIEFGSNVIEHIPDYLFEGGGHRFRAEVKGTTAFLHDDELARKLVGIALAYERYGLRYEVARTEHLRANPAAKNYRLIYDNRLRPVTDENRELLLGIVHSTDMTSVEAILTDAPKYPVGSNWTNFSHSASDLLLCLKQDLARLHADGLISLDLSTGEIGPATRVRAGIVRQTPPWFRLPSSGNPFLPFSNQVSELT